MFEHPLGLALLPRDVAHDVLGEAAVRGGAGGVGVGPAELVAARCPRARGCAGRWSSSTSSPVPVACWCGTVTLLGGGDVGGAHAVAVGDRRESLDVACRATPERPRSRPRRAAGTRSATCATGQWCWHSCSPAGRRGDGRRSVAVRGQRLGKGLGTLDRGRPRRRRRSASRCSATRRRANAATAASPPVASARKRSASTARSSYAGRSRSRPASVRREDLGRPAAAAGCRRPAARGPRSTPSASIASRWRRTAAAVSAETLREVGRRAGAELEQRPGDPLARARSRPSWPRAISTTPLWRYCVSAGFQTRRLPLYLHRGARRDRRARSLDSRRDRPPTPLPTPGSSPPWSSTDLRHGVRRQAAVDGLRLTRRPRQHHRRPRAQRRRQDHHPRDLRGLPRAPTPAGSGSSGSTRRRSVASCSRASA